MTIAQTGENYKGLVDLSVVVFTKDRPKLLMDLISFWAPYPVTILVFDGSNVPITKEIMDSIDPHICTVRLFAARSLWERFKICSQNLQTGYAIWHSDDDFWLPEVVDEAIVKNRWRLEEGEAIFSTVRGFSLKHLQNPYSVLDWEKRYSLTENSIERRVASFSENRANRYFYAIWPVEQFKVALYANAKASIEINQEKLIFADIGMELAGAILLKLRIFEKNFILKRFGDSVISADDVIDVPTISQVLGGEAFLGMANKWVDSFSIEISSHIEIPAQTIKNIIEKSLGTISESEKKERFPGNNTKRNVLTRISTFLKQNGSNSLFFRSTHRLGSKTYRKIYLPICAPFKGYIPWILYKWSNNRELRKVLTIVKKQQKYK